MLIADLKIDYQFRIGPLLLLILPNLGRAQQTTLSIRQTLEKVASNLPALEAVRHQAQYMQENISLAKNSLVPDLTVGYQANMATFNNITGMSYPGYLLPISGPPAVNNEMNFVPGTAAGMLLKWNPVTFGQRQAAIQSAVAQYKAANATYNEQLFRYQFEAINVYLEAVGLLKVKQVAGAVIDRYRINLDQSLVLARTGLKPGVDTAQFQSALAQAEIDYLVSEKNYLQKMTELSRLTGLTVQADRLRLTDTLLQSAVLREDSVSIINHPVYQAMEAQKNQTAAGLLALRRSWVPQLDLWGNLYARGSGISANGTINKSEGWGFSRTNAGIGIQLSFPVLQFSRLSIQKRQYDALLKADVSRLEQVRLNITKQVENATFQYQQDLKIAVRTPFQLNIARSVYEGLKISYEAGLIEYTRLYQAQYELTRSEINHVTAQLQLWRSLLGLAIAQGNLSLFLDQLNQ